MSCLSFAFDVTNDGARAHRAAVLTLTVRQYQGLHPDLGGHTDCPRRAGRRPGDGVRILRL